MTQARHRCPCPLLLFSIAAIASVLDAHCALCAVTGGVFSFHPHDANPHLYGSIDVIHVLGSVGLLGNLTDAQKDAWAATIDSYQNETTGFYRTPHGAPGSQPFHGAGEATASLALLGRRPKYLNANYTALATQGPADWHAFFDPLVQANGTRCYKSKIGGNDIHGCGQIIGSVPSVLAATTGDKYLPFLQWWRSFIANQTDPTRGVICPIDNSTEALYECLGGGMATHGIELGLGLGFRLSAPAALLDFALSMQDEDDGLFHGDASSMSLDGIFQVTRSSLQLNRSKWDRVQDACARLLATQAKNLNDGIKVLGKFSKDSHGLPNVVANVAECSQTFPSLVKTRRPWRCCARYV